MGNPAEEPRISRQDAAGTGNLVRHKLVDCSLRQQPWAHDLQVMKGPRTGVQLGRGHGRPRMETGE